MATQGFPKEDAYGLTSQIRRAAVSIPSNIAEGAARDDSKKFARFLGIVKGSLSELETQLLISAELGYFQKEHQLLGYFQKEHQLGWCFAHTRHSLPFKA